MTKSFGSRSTSGAATASASPSGGAAKASKSQTKTGGGKSDKGTHSGLVLGLGVVSAAAVGLALWALFTGAAPFMMIFFAMFVFAMIMTVIGQSLK
ncbi:MAG: hypothetical protein AAFR20_02305 [Pseudomonadota bacterium]